MERLAVARHRNFYIAIALGVLTVAILVASARDYAVAAAANVFFLAYVVLTGTTVPKLTADFLRQHAAEEDEPAPFILVVMLVAVAAATGSFFLVLNGGQHTAIQLVMAVLAVVLGWFAVHTMWAMHYAYEYYQSADRTKEGRRAGKVAEGLDFHSPEQPSGVAFVYFAYVLGMTAQTADVDVVSNAMRRLVLVHSVFSFFFNTVILAGAVNIAVAFGH